MENENFWRVWRSQWEGMVGEEGVTPPKDESGESETNI